MRAYPNFEPYLRVRRQLRRPVSDGGFFTPHLFALAAIAGPSFRFYRRDDLDTWQSKPDQPRDDLLRELIDQLPEIQQHLVSRVYFGQSHRVDAAAELGISPRKAKEQLEQALETLRGLLLDGDTEVGPLSAAALARQS